MFTADSPSLIEAWRTMHARDEAMVLARNASAMRSGMVSRYVSLARRFQHLRNLARAEIRREFHEETGGADWQPPARKGQLALF